MANLSWKSSTLLTATLLVAFGLQAGAIKILLNLDRQPDTTMTVGVRALPMKPVAVTSAATANEQRSVINPPVPVSEVATLSDPPPPDHATTHTESPRNEPNPEANVSMTSTTPATIPSDPPPPDSNPSATTDITTPPVTPSVEATTTKPTESATAGGLRDAAWLKTRESKNYTVQLYSGKDLDKLKEIATSISLTGPQAYFTTGSRSTPWYSLVIGDYPDGASARAAAAAISAQSAQIKPWVRRFDDIQTSLR